MNKAIRKEISVLVEKLTTLKEQFDLDLKAQVETIRDNEQEKLDNMPEGLQSGEPGNKLEEVINHLDSAVDALENVASEIDDCISSLNEIE